ncbi:MAG: hypothetical protein AAB758_02625 [Patescibacteria group bacterium]
MKRDPNAVLVHEMPMSAAEFMESFNKNMPEGYPHVTISILERFQQAHLSLFKSRNTWSLDQHRKRMIEWLPQNRI